MSFLLVYVNVLEQWWCPTLPLFATCDDMSFKCGDNHVVTVKLVDTFVATKTKRM